MGGGSMGLADCRSLALICAGARRGVVWQGLAVFGALGGFDLRGRSVSVVGGIRGGAWVACAPGALPRLGLVVVGLFCAGGRGGVKMGGVLG